jgi:hypothetical protein
MASKIVMASGFHGGTSGLVIQRSDESNKKAAPRAGGLSVMTIGATNLRVAASYSAHDIHECTSLFRIEDSTFAA